MGLMNQRKSAVSAVRSGALVLDELSNAKRNGQQQKNMNAAAFVQQDSQNEPSDKNKGAPDP